MSQRQQEQKSRYSGWDSMLYVYIGVLWVIVTSVVVALLADTVLDVEDLTWLILLTLPGYAMLLIGLIARGVVVGQREWASSEHLDYDEDNEG